MRWLRGSVEMFPNSLCSSALSHACKAVVRSAISVDCEGSCCKTLKGLREALSEYMWSTSCSICYYTPTIFVVGRGMICLSKYAYGPAVLVVDSTRLLPRECCWSAAVLVVSVGCTVGRWDLWSAWWGMISPRLSWFGVCPPMFCDQSSLLHSPLDTIKQDSTFSSQLPLTIPASTSRLCHCLSESFPLLGLLSSFSLRPLIGFAAFLGFSLLALGSAMFFCERNDLLTTTVVDAVEIWLGVDCRSFFCDGSRWWWWALWFWLSWCLYFFHDLLLDLLLLCGFLWWLFLFILARCVCCWSFRLDVVSGLSLLFCVFLLQLRLFDQVALDLDCWKRLSDYEGADYVGAHVLLRRWVPSGRFCGPTTKPFLCFFATRSAGASSRGRFVMAIFYYVDSDWGVFEFLWWFGWWQSWIAGNLFSLTQNAERKRKKLVASVRGFNTRHLSNLALRNTVVPCLSDCTIVLNVWWESTEGLVSLLFHRIYFDLPSTCAMLQLNIWGAEDLAAYVL